MLTLLLAATGCLYGFCFLLLVVLLLLLHEQKRSLDCLSNWIQKVAFLHLRTRF